MLEVTLLGQFAVRVGKKPVNILSRPAQLLLAFLLLNAGTKHLRERLAALLWPDAAEENARQNLRNALWKLNKALGNGYFLTDKTLIGFDVTTNYRLDTALLENADSTTSDALITAVSAYQGELLPGFYDEWVLLERERLQALFEQRMQVLLEGLVAERRWQEVLSWAERWIAFGQVPEPAYRALLSTHAALGDAAGMASVYRRCVKALEEELGVEPSPDTKELYERLSRGETSLRAPVLQTQAAVPLPAFLKKDEVRVKHESFIGQEEVLAQLFEVLEQAFVDGVKVKFLAGEAGQGKTSLLSEFSRRAHARYQDLVVAFGSCNAMTGAGDPYLPFRDTLAMLTGDAEAPYLAGTISRDHALRLWHLLPNAVKALLDHAPELLDTLVSRNALSKRVVTFAQQRNPEQLAKLVANTESKPKDGNRLLEAYTKLLEDLSRQRPLMLVLDDLHWADPASMGLLFHLGRRLGGSRLLILGAYRPEDVLRGRDGEQHPLESVLGELERQFGEIVIDLGERAKVAPLDFVNALLDEEPNQLREGFRQVLAQRTQGHPLSTVELVREMKTRGYLLRNDAGQWVESLTLDWNVLPAKVEGIIRTRTGRLDSELREALTIGSVEGEVFTAEVVAKVASLDDRLLIRRLSSEAQKQHQLIKEQGWKRMGVGRLSQYRFRHNLFQQYLYQSLGAVDRAYLHEAVGNALESLYGEKSEEIAVSLARHFQEAGLADKAVHYLLLAGQRATQLSAHEEAVTHLRQGLDLLVALPKTVERDEQELELLLALGMPLQALKGYASPEVGAVFERAQVLLSKVGNSQQRFLTLWNLWTYHAQHAELARAREVGSELLSLAKEVQDSALLLQAHHTLWFTTLCAGDFAAACSHAEEGTKLYDPEVHREHAFVYGGHDPGVCSRLFLARALWYLGYPDKALTWCQEALELAQDSAHPNTLAHAHIFAAELYLLRREGNEAQALADRAIKLSREHGFSHWLAWGKILRGCALAERQPEEEGTELIREGLAEYRAIGGELECASFLIRLAEAYGRLGKKAEGLEALAEARREIEKSGKHHAEAELYRVQGELTGEEECFRRALEISRSQEAKALELRAAIGLGQLYRKRGRFAEIQQVLSDIYGQFMEGFDVLDSRMAKTLLLP